MAQNTNKVAARASAFLIKDHLEAADLTDVYGAMGAAPLG